MIDSKYNGIEFIPNMFYNHQLILKNGKCTVLAIGEGQIK